MTTEAGRSAGEGVRVTAPARLHLGFLDLDGSLGRQFGSLGLSLERPVTKVRLRRSDARRVLGPDSARAEAALARLAGVLDVDGRVELVVEEALPPHCGLGSGTQLRLAIGAGLAALYGFDLSPREIARILDRGQRSAIGIGAFEGGGVILDGGRGRLSDDPPPIISRMTIPPQWRILLVQDRNVTGLNGTDEARAISDLPPFPEELAGRLCRLVLMKALPGLLEGDCAAFGAAVSEMQRRLGDHFATAQGGRFTSQAVAEVLEWAEAQGAEGIGQSSWGPTGFALLGDPGRAEIMLDEARQRWRNHPSLVFDLVRGNNSGAEITRLRQFEPQTLP